MYRKYLILLLLVALGLFFVGASSNEQPRRLQAEKISSFRNVPAEAITTPIKCDADQNIVLQVVQGSNLDHSPIALISQNGRRAILYHVSNLSIPNKARVADYFYKAGVLYVLLEGEGRTAWVAEYDDNGHLRNTVRLEGNLDPMQIAVTQSGDLLVAGGEVGVTTTGPEHFVRTYTADGHLVRQMHLAGDVTIQSTPQARREFDRSVRGSVLQTDANGYIYIMRLAEKGPLFVISPSGEQRSINLNAPEGAINSGTLAVTADRVAVEFLTFKANNDNHEIDTALIEVIDIHSGQVVSQLENHGSTGMACYDGQTFLFVGTDATSHLKLVRARPE